MNEQPYLGFHCLPCKGRALENVSYKLVSIYLEVSKARLTRCSISVTSNKEKNIRSVNLKIGSWNVRTLLSDTRTSAIRPERRTALVSRELARLDIDISSLSETRLADEGQLEEVGQDRPGQAIRGTADWHQQKGHYYASAS